MRTVGESLSVLVLVAAVAVGGCGKEPERTLRPVDEPAADPAATTSSAASAVALPADLPPKFVTRADAPSIHEGPRQYRIDPPSFELGVVDSNTVHDLEFSVVNQGDRPFNVVYVTTECKCMTLDVDRKMLKPGDSIKVAVRVVANASNERKTAAILHLSDQAKSKVRVEVHYAIVPDILVEPKGVGFGRVESGKTATASIRVTMHLPATITTVPKLEPFISHDLPIKLRFDEPVITATAGGQRDWVAMLHLELDGSQPLEQFLTQLCFIPKDKLLHRELVMRVTGEVVPAWYFERGVVAFGSVDVGKAVEKEMRFFYPSAEAPAVESIECDVAGLEVAHEVDAAQRCIVLNLKYNAPAPAKVEGVVKLKTSLSPQPSELRITARVK
ncbi:MAG: DUF1573 domain-containing protein [Planctomycetes bacterium]|nr:DUF1573 domain-containing protein [Planctomycetota bacterium]